MGGWLDGGIGRGINGVMHGQLDGGGIDRGMSGWLDGRIGRGINEGMHKKLD